MEDGRWKMEDAKWKDGRWQVAGGRSSLSILQTKRLFSILHFLSSILYPPSSIFGSTRLWVLLLSSFLLILTSACNSVGVYRPEATESALEGTVSALQGTIAALEASGATPAEGTSQVIVVTATAEATLTPSPTMSSHSASTATVSPIPLSTPTAAESPTTSSQGETIILATATSPPPALPSPTPTTKTYLDAPLLIEPADGTIIEEGRQILLRWSWSGSLGPNEHFDIKLRPDGQESSAFVAWEESETHDFMANLRPGRYYWSVQVIKGHYSNERRAPEDRVFEAFLGPESERRLIIIGKQEPKSPRSVSQADPPAPSMPYVWLFGSVAFVAFIGLTRRR